MIPLLKHEPNETRFGIDVDGVIVDFDRGWIERFNEQYGMDPEYPTPYPNQPQAWNWVHRLAGMPTLTEWWEWFETTGGFWRLPYYEAAISGLKAIMLHYPTYLVTSRPSYGRAPVYQMIEENNLEDQLQGVIFESEKFKAPIDVLVDDRAKNLVQFTEHHNAYTCAVRVNRPWNEPSYLHGTERQVLRQLPSVDGLYDLADGLNLLPF